VFPETSNAFATSGIVLPSASIQSVSRNFRTYTRLRVSSALGPLSVSSGRRPA
jgi:hypothetical protein